jgi:glycosyltransferase involved in cell wall biosynthesis
MDLTVIVCTYNRANSLGETLAALSRQVTPQSFRWELLVIDNNSDDETQAVVERFAPMAPVPTRYLFEPKQGLSHARNAGIASAKSNIVAFTDDDVTPEPDWVFWTFAAVRDHSVDGVGGRILPKWSASPPKWLATDRMLLSLLALQDLEQGGPVTAHNGVRIFGANMAFRREGFAEIGPFDVTRGRVGAKLAGGEETEFVQRALAAGKCITYDPRLVVWHHVGPDRMRKQYFRKWRFDSADNDAFWADSLPGRDLYGIPLYLLKALPGRLASWLWALARRDDSVFAHELAILANIGFLVGFARRRRHLARIG